jgi:hypothetical protein
MQYSLCAKIPAVSTCDLSGVPSSIQFAETRTTSKQHHIMRYHRDAQCNGSVRTHVYKADRPFVVRKTLEERLQQLGLVDVGDTDLFYAATTVCDIESWQMADFEDIGLTTDDIAAENDQDEAGCESFCHGVMEESLDQRPSGAAVRAGLLPPTGSKDGDIYHRLATIQFSSSVAPFDQFPIYLLVDVDLGITR